MGLNDYYLGSFFRLPFPLFFALLFQPQKMSSTQAGLQNP